MTTQIEMEQSGDVLTVRWSRRGRAMLALYRTLKLFPWVMGGLAVFFLPDYFFRYAEEEPVTGLFWGSLAALALLITLLAATLRYLRNDQWIFDGTDRTVTAEVQTLWGDPAQGEAELRELEALMLRTRAWPRKSQLMMRLESGEEEVLFANHGLSTELEEIADRIIDFLREQRYHVDLERIDGDDPGDNPED